MNLERLAVTLSGGLILTSTASSSVVAVLRGSETVSFTFRTDHDLPHQLQIVPGTDQWVRICVDHAHPRDDRGRTFTDEADFEPDRGTICSLTGGLRRTR